MKVRRSTPGAAETASIESATANGYVPNGLGKGSGPIPVVEVDVTSPVLQVKVRSSEPGRCPSAEGGSCVAGPDDEVVASGEKGSRR